MRFRPTRCPWLPIALFLAYFIPAAIGISQVGYAADTRFPLFQYLTATPSGKMVTYTPSALDPRDPANQSRLSSSSIRADLEAVRPAFDGLILYGYHEACTPRIVAIAADLKFRAVILGIWDPKSTAEIDGVVALSEQFESRLALGVLLGNEGLTFNRYEAADLLIGSQRLKWKLPKNVPVSTSEPLVGYERPEVRAFGDFLAPNIHPVFDRKTLGPAESALWSRQEAEKLAVDIKKPVVLKETGFPHGGEAKFTPDSQRQFWDAYTGPGLLQHETSDHWVFHGVAFEAFDLPWKSQESGLAIEKSWGLFSPDRRPYPAFEVWKADR